MKQSTRDLLDGLWVLGCMLGGIFIVGALWSAVNWRVVSAALTAAWLWCSAGMHAGKRIEQEKARKRRAVP